MVAARKGDGYFSRRSVVEWFCFVFIQSVLNQRYYTMCCWKFSALAGMLN